MIRAAVIACVVVALGGVARAEKFDPTGWKMIAVANIDDGGKIELNAGKYLGDVDQVTVVALRGSLSVTRVTLGWNDATRTKKKVNERLQDTLPGVVISVSKPSQVITKIWIDCTEVEDHARIAVFARDSQAVAEPAKVATSWSPTGWVKLGTVSLGRSNVASQRSRVRETMGKVALVPTEDLDVSDLRLNLLDGSTSAYLSESGTTLWPAGEPHVIDLAARLGPVGVTKFSFSFVINNAKSATVVAYGLPEAKLATTKTAAASASTGSTEGGPLEGWTLLGEDEVDLVEDQIEVERSKSTWAEIAVVVTGDAVDIESLAVHFKGKDDVQRAELGVTFEDGTSRRIEVTGKRRAIEKIQLSYRKHKLDAATRVQVYAR